MQSASENILCSSDLDIQDTDDSIEQCITCLNRENLLPIGSIISSEFSYFADIQVNSDDFICNKCVCQLSSACHFKRQCLNSLKKIRSETKLKENNSKSLTICENNESELTVSKTSQRVSQKKLNPASNKSLIPSNKSENVKKSLVSTKSIEQINFIRKGRLPNMNKNRIIISSKQRSLNFPSNNSLARMKNESDVKSKSMDNVANYCGQVCREIYSKMDAYKQYKKKHFSQLTNLFINEMDPVIKPKAIAYRETSGVCSSCGKVFKQLNKHILVCPCIKRKGRKKLCDKCGKVLTDLSKHKCSHENSTMANKSHTCDKCLKTFNGYKSLWSHKKYVHQGNKTKFNCPICSKSYSNASSKREHVITKHKNGPMPHSCKTCNKGFPTTTKLKRHIKIHSNPLAFECFICFASFTKTTDLAQHMKNKHEDIFLPPNCQKKLLPIKYAN